jgi:hypothetical protein
MLNLKAEFFEMLLAVTFKRLMRTTYFSRWFYRYATLFTLCAVLFGALAPSLGHAAKNHSKKILVEICNAQGLSVVALDAENNQVPGQAEVNASCPLCVLQNDQPTIPESSATSQRSATRVDSVSVNTSTLEPPSALIWAAHYTRAPPRLS